eukprot:85023_1
MSEESLSNKKRKLDSLDGEPVVSGDGSRYLLSCFSRDDLIDFVSKNVETNGLLRDSLAAYMDNMPDIRKLFIRGVSFETTDESLREALEQFGEMSECSVARDSRSGRSKGFAFVTYDDVSGALAAIQAHELELDGRTLYLHSASEKKEKKNGGGRAGVPANQFTPSSTPGASSWNTSSAAGETKLFIRGLKWETSSETLRRAFEPYGAIKEAVVCQDRETRRSKGFGFVTFVSPAGAQAACQQPMKMIDGREIQCNFACDRRKPGDRAPGRAGPTGFTTSRGPPVQAMGMMAGAAQAAHLQQLQQLQMLQQQNQQLRLLEAQQVSAYQQPMSAPTPGGGPGGASAMTSQLAQLQQQQMELQQRLQQLQQPAGGAQY